MEVFCTKNDGYKWTELPEGSFKGYLQPSGNPKPLRGEEAVRYLVQAESFEDFQELLKNLDGLYAVILPREGGVVWAAVDSSRSMPLYYSKDGRFLSDSGPAVREALGIPREAADPAALEELFYSTHIAGPRTAYAEISQLDAGQAMEHLPGGEIRTAYYYTHIQKTRDIGREEAMRLFQQASDQVFDQVIAAIAGRPVVLSLSGGYDSRYVACMLKAKGVEDVSCYTYGRADSFEIRQSEKIAKALGWRWACVEYTDEIKFSFLNPDPVTKDYFQKSETYDYALVSLQNHPAVRHLHETGWFKPGSVFLTGILNDVPAGQHTLNMQRLFDSRFSEETFPEAVAGPSLLKRMSGTARASYLDIIARQRRALGLSFTSYQEFANAAEELRIIRDYSRLAPHMNDSHAFFGYEWLSPCWSRGLLEFWYSIPLEYRLSQSLFEEWIMTRLPAQYGVGQKKTIVSYTTFRGWERTKARAQLLLKRTVCLPLGIPLREKQDINNFGPLEAKVFRRLHQKNRIGFRNSGWNSIFSLYMMERLYGPNCLKK